MLKTIVFAQSKFMDVKDRLASLGRDEDGAALIEYSLLIGLIVVGVVSVIGLVGGKVLGNWNALNDGFK